MLGNSIAMRENKLERVQPHARYLITGSNVGMIFALSLVISALFPFMDTDLTSNALLIGLMIAIIVPCLFVIITGPLWVPDARKRQVVQFIAAMFTFITCLVFMIDLFSVDEWVGLPLVQWLGLQWTYSYHPVMFFFSALLGNLFISSTGFFDANVEPYKRDKNSLLMGTVTVIGLGWILVSLFLHAGAIWGLAVMLVIAAIQAIFLFTSIITGAGNGDRMKNSVDAIKGGSTTTPGSIKEIIKNGRNGSLHVVKAFLSFLPIFAMIMANALIVNQLLPKPNYLPLWIDFFPILFLGSVCFVILAKIIKNRFMMLFPPLILLLLLALVSISTPYAMEYKHTTLLLISGFSLPGAVLAGSLHARHMATGRFSKIAWGAIATFMMVGAFVYGISVKSEVYDELGWQIAIASCFVGIPLFIIGRIMSSMKGFWNKGLRNRRSRAARVESFTPAKEVTSSITMHSRQGTAGRGFKWDDTAKMSMILVFSLAMVTATIVPVLVTSAGTTEHVLGTYKGEYYLWEASSLRNIDAGYRPNLAASPVNAKARISMARGEHEGIQVIFTPRRIKNLNVLSFEPTSDLIHQGAGPSIDKGNISVFNVGYVKQLGKQYPDQLQPFTPLDTSISVNLQSNYPFYIDVFIPRNDSFEPGIYQATMKFHCRDYRAQPPGIERQYIHRDVTFILEVEVYNFTVPLERHIATEIIWSIPEEQQWWDFYADHRLDWNMKHDLVTGLNVNSSLGPLSISFDWAPFIAKLNESFNRGTRYFPVALGFLSQYNIPGLNWNTLD
ncbi:hypothetical protein GF325_09645, partial [Candidatus Bathyarchaeota archaeon]|nr:hypothetical protein [Candidatus Bathyarchaeota archaeon]